MTFEEWMAKNYALYEQQDYEYIEMNDAFLAGYMAGMERSAALAESKYTEPHYFNGHKEEATYPCFDDGDEVAAAIRREIEK